MPDGTPIDLERRYSVCTSAYMASGSNDTSQVADQISYRKTDLRFHDAAFAYAKSLKVLAVED